MRIWYAASAMLLGIFVISGYTEEPGKGATMTGQTVKTSASTRTPNPESTTALLQRIRKTTMFADLHAHPSYIHRGSPLEIEERELDNFRRGQIDIVMAAVTPDGYYGGNYFLPDGTYVAPTHQIPAPGDVFKYTRMQLSKIQRTVESGRAALARSPAEARAAQASGKVALVPTLEGGDGLYPNVENLRTLYREDNVRVLQLVHMSPNEIGMSQSAYQWLPGGLSEFGKQIVREANDLGIVIDLAHSSHQTVMDALAVTRHPVIFSHSGAEALVHNPRHLTDEEIKAIARSGGVIGVWPTVAVNPRVKDMVDHIDYIKRLVGIDHVGIGSDLRGLDTQGFAQGFGRGLPPVSSKGMPITTPEDVNYLAIFEELLARGYTNEELAKVAGGNFIRVWEKVTVGKAKSATTSK